MKLFLFIVNLFFSIHFFAQVDAQFSKIDKKIDLIPKEYNTSTEAIANYIHSNFKSDDDKIRAVFYWTASNLTYDFQNMFVLKNNFTPDKRINQTLLSKKGICGDYAAVFNSIATLVGIKSIVVSGYTKQNGKIDILSHAWCAAFLNKKWYIFDPTWGSGGVVNGKYVSKIHNKYFKMDPLNSISSHIPFDYLFQFSNYPVTNAEFYEGKTQLNSNKKYFDFEKELAKQNSLSETDLLFESNERIEKNGLINQLIVDFYENNKNRITSLRQNQNIDKLNLIVKESNDAVANLNSFISYRNKKFSPTLPDDEILRMIQRPKEQLIKCQNDISRIFLGGNLNESNLNDMKMNIETNLSVANVHEAFVLNYLSKSKLIRKTMFSKFILKSTPSN